MTISFPRMTRGNFELCLRQFIRECHRFVEDKINEDWSAYEVTFIFRSLPSSSYWRRVQMIRAIEDFFSSFVTRIVRYPNSSLDNSPILIAIEDPPAGKWKERPSVLHLLSNEGQHFRAFLLIPPKARLKTSVKRHFEEYMKMYLGDRKVIDRIEALPITKESSFGMICYVLEGLEHGLSPKRVLILPYEFSRS